MDIVGDSSSLWWWTGQRRAIGTKSQVRNVLGGGKSRTPITLKDDSTSTAAVGNPAQGRGVDELFDGRTHIWIRLKHPVNNVVKRIRMVFVCHERRWIGEFKHTRLGRPRITRINGRLGNLLLTITCSDIDNERNAAIVSFDVTVGMPGEGGPLVKISSAEGTPLFVAVG